MPVIINEFEITPEAAPPPEAGPRRDTASPSQEKKEKPDFENVLRHWHERAERVRAH